MKDFTTTFGILWVFLIPVNLAKCNMYFPSSFLNFVKTKTNICVYTLFLHRLQFPSLRNGVYFYPIVFVQVYVVNTQL